MHPPPKRLPVSLVAALLCGTAALQQTACAATLLKERGSVVAKVTPPADVELRDATGVPVATVKANGCSVAAFEDLSDGVYSITATHGGSELVANEIRVVRGRDTTVDFLSQTRSAAPAPPPADKRSCSGPRFMAGPSVLGATDFLQHAQGCLVASCLLTSLGTVRGCEVLESPDPLLNKQLVKVLEQRRYQPAVCDGKAIDTQYTFRTYFRTRY